MQNKMTKNCIHPWKTMNVFGDGTLLPCCGQPPGDFGNVLTELKDGFPTIFKNADYKKIRKSLLDGDLVQECENCRIVPDEKITTEELKNSINNLLVSNGHNLNEINLLTSSSIQDFIVSITNKCNLRCVYCPQSAPKSNSTSLNNWFSSIDFYKAEIDEEEFFSLLDFLIKQGLKRLNFVGLGELTIYKKWQTLVNRVFDAYPKLHVSMVSNFSVPFDDKDIETLLKFNQISVSCDTLDEDTFNKIRVGGKLKVVLNNLELLLKAKGVMTAPVLAFNVTESDLVVDKLEILARYAAKNGMHINFSNLYDAPGTVMNTTKCLKKISELSDSEMPRLWEILNGISRRMKAENSSVEIGQIGPFFDYVKSKANEISRDFIVPKDHEIIYIRFKDQNNGGLGAEAYLRNIYTKFDTEYRGIYIPKNTTAIVDLSQSDIDNLRVRIALVRERKDENLEIGITESFYIKIDKKLPLFINSSFDGNEFTHVLFEIEPSEKTASDQTNEIRIAQATVEKLFIREGILIQDVDRIIRKIEDEGQEVVIWCAGARTQTLYDWSSLSRLNVKALVDSNYSIQGTKFIGHLVQSPDSIIDFSGPIIVCNATNPYAVEKYILNSKFKSKNIYLI